MRRGDKSRANHQARQGVPSYLKKPGSKLYLGASFHHVVRAMLTLPLRWTCIISSNTSYS